jgi:hypothetical protein
MENNERDMDDSNLPDSAFVEYNFELELTKDKKQECRDIVKEIKRFGVSQRQMLYVIYLLGLEFVNSEVMNSVCNAAKSCRKLLLPSSSDSSNIILSADEP